MWLIAIRQLCHTPRPFVLLCAAPCAPLPPPLRIDSWPFPSNSLSIRLSHSICYTVAPLVFSALYHKHFPACLPGVSSAFICVSHTAVPPLETMHGFLVSLKDVRAHCYCASLVRTLFIRHARATSFSHQVENSTKYRADNLCVNLVCEYFCWMLGDPLIFSADHFLF